MTDDKSSSTQDYREKVVIKNRGGSGIAGAVYGMAFIGAAVYYIMQATTFWAGVLGFLEGLVWPAMLIFKLFEFLKM
jgi:hypothetical protein